MPLNLPRLIQRFIIGDLDVSGIRKRKILASNHPRWADAFLFMIIFPNHKIMANDGILRLFKWFLGPNCYSHKGGIETSIKLLNRGHSIIICPNGWTDSPYKEHKFHTGVAVIAIKTKNLVTPVKITYNSKAPNWVFKFHYLISWFLDAILTKRSGATVKIGEPIGFYKYDFVDDYTEAIRKGIDEL